MIIDIILFWVRICPGTALAGAIAGKARRTGEFQKVARVVVWLDYLNGLAVAKRANQTLALVAIPLVPAQMAKHHLSAGRGIQVAVPRTGRRHLGLSATLLVLLVLLVRSECSKS